jgi:hypothetical protein
MVHEIGALALGDDGPDRAEVDVTYSDSGAEAGRWRVSVNVYPHDELVDKLDPDQWDEDNQQVIPESGWSTEPARMLQLAELLTNAANQALLFQSAAE